MITERRTSWTATELLATDFPEPRFAVPGIIAEGLNLLVGPPKVAKSFMALNFGIAIASGGHALGMVPVEQGEVFYLALEDGPRRLRHRLEMTLGTDHAPEGLHFETEWTPLCDGGADELDGWLRRHPDTRLVVIDVLARLRSPLKTSVDRYQADYMVAEEVKKVADAHNVSVVAVHHTRKQLADDFIDSVSGTQGLAGAADSIVVVRRSRGQSDATLHVVGRDIEEQELALNFEGHIGTWSLLGDAQEWRLSENRRQIIEAIREAGPLRPKDIADALELPAPLVRQTVSRMAKDDQLINTAGTYSLALSQVSQVSLEQVKGPLGVTVAEQGVTPPVTPNPPSGERVTGVTEVTPATGVTGVTPLSPPLNGFGGMAQCDDCGRHTYYYDLGGHPKCPSHKDPARVVARADQ